MEIKVKPLPQEGKPDSFTGAVGKFSFTSSIDNDSISANDAIGITLKLIGSGNLDLLKAPEIKFPSDFETYEPKVINNIRTGDRGVSGSKKIEYLAIVRNPGDFVIEPIKFSYFNPASKKYQTMTAGPYNIHVTKGKGGSQGISYSSSAQEDIRFIGEILNDPKIPSELRDMLWAILSHIAALTNIDLATYRKLLFKTKYVISLIKMSVPDYMHNLGFYIKLEQVETYVILQLRRAVNGFERRMLVSRRVEYIPVPQPQNVPQQPGLLQKVAKVFGI